VGGLVLGARKARAGPTRRRRRRRRRRRTSVDPNEAGDCCCLGRVLPPSIA
jgi:hypothetical protein